MKPGPRDDLRFLTVMIQIVEGHRSISRAGIDQPRPQRTSVEPGA